MVELETAAAPSRDEQHLARSLASRSSETHAQKRDTLVRDSYFRLIRGVSRRICFSSSPERGLPSKACVLLWRLAGGP